MINKFATVAACAVALCGTGLATQTNAAFADSTTVITHSSSYQTDPSDAVHIRVVIDGAPVDFDGPGPIMMNGGYVFVPIRGVFEQMGGDVQWHADSQVIEGVRPGHVFRIRVGSTNALVNGEDTTLPAPPQLIGGTTYVPLRFASESLGAHVRWAPDTSTVYIRSHGDTDEDGSVDTDVHHHMRDDSTTEQTNDDGSSTTTTIIKKTTTP
jgi:hypothetical protein